MLRYLALALAVSFGISLDTQAQEKSALAGQRPNIYIFMADDQYLASVGAYGAEPSHTPNIDRLAAEGVKYTRCFMPSSICTPNRAAFLSGMLPLKNGAHPNHSGFFDGVKSLPNYMRELGYRACLVNKDGIRKQSDLYEWEFRILESDKLAPGATDPRSRRHRQSRFDEIEAFIASGDDRPFCILHASRQPHTPYLGKLPNGLEGYDASNHYMDSEFGRALDLLEKHGLAENTIVLYINDNEANIPRSKYTLYDTALIVPCIVRWPGRIAAGMVSDAMISGMDFLPTIVSLAGGDRNPQWDGKSLLPLWEGATRKLYDGLYFSYTNVSLGSNRDSTPYPMRAYRTDRYKYIRTLNPDISHPKQDNAMFPTEALYDIIGDPAETNNLAGDPKYRETLEQLRAQIDQWMHATNDQGIQSELNALARYPVQD